jgi:hypothetical protein
MIRRPLDAVSAGLLGLALATVVSAAPQAPATATKARIADMSNVLGGNPLASRPR